MKKGLIFVYCLLLPIINISSIITSIRNIFQYPVFLFKWIKYKFLSNEKVSFFDLYPCLNDKSSSSQTGKGHYFYQDIWALKKVKESGVADHVDIASRIDGFAGQCSSICKVEFVDYRAVDITIPNFTSKSGSILNLPYETDSVSSLSCLHVIEHIGLGRYGDPVDFNGTYKASSELSRILKPSGNLYIGVPIGQERVVFNAHRVFFPQSIIKMFKGLSLVSFSAVNDSGEYIEHPCFDDFNGSKYSCGLFHFTK